MQRKDFIATGILSGISLAAFPSLVSAKAEDTPKQFTIQPREPLTPGPGSVDMRTIIHSGQTSGQFSNVEIALAPKQMGPAPHLHADLDELMYVLEGTASVLIGSEVYEVKAGGWNFRPRGIPHSFWNSQDVPLRFIDCFFNQPFEDYLEEFIHKIIPEMTARKLTPASPTIAKTTRSTRQEIWRDMVL